MKASIGLGVKLTGHVLVEKWSDKRGTKERLEFDNVVLDAGWDWIWQRFPGNNSFNSNNGGGDPIIVPDYSPSWLFLGTGTTAPQKTDNGLEAVSTTLGGKYIHSKETTTVIPSYKDSGIFEGLIAYPEELYHRARLRFDYSEGEAQGNWTELGLGFMGPSYTNPFNRALFKDEHGTPIVVTVLSDEFLRVFVEIRMHWDCSEKSVQFNWNGNPIHARFNINAWVDSVNPMHAEGLAAYSFFDNGFPINGNIRAVDASQLPMSKSDPDSLGNTIPSGLLITERETIQETIINHANKSATTNFTVNRQVGCDTIYIAGFGFCWYNATEPELLGCKYHRVNTSMIGRSIVAYLDDGESDFFSDSKDETEDLVGSIEIAFARAE